jgi:hypothetical protein
MLLHPYRNRVVELEGCRRIADLWGLVGMCIQHPNNPQRVWQICTLFSPIQRRALGGIRARLLDNKGFVTFVNQRDLEVLIGNAQPGEMCPWTGKEYPAPGDREWYGFAVDEEDLEDDRFELEEYVRTYYPQGIPAGTEVHRRVHFGSYDGVQLTILLWDVNPDTGELDVKRGTLHRRWSVVETVREEWNYMPLEDSPVWVPSRVADIRAATARRASHCL